MRACACLIAAVALVACPGCRKHRFGGTHNITVGGLFTRSESYDGHVRYVIVFDRASVGLPGQGAGLGSLQGPIYGGGAIDFSCVDDDVARFGKREYKLSDGRVFLCEIGEDGNQITQLPVQLSRFDPPAADDENAPDETWKLYYDMTSHTIKELHRIALEDATMSAFLAMYSPEARWAAGSVWRAVTLPTLSLDLGDGVKMELLLVPAGEFTMGSPDSDYCRSRDEQPQHRVRITRSFYLGRYEVTQAQYERIMGANPSRFKGSNRPVMNVSWDEANEFCRKLSKRTDRTARLPTEAEWEYACRAGMTTRYCFGDRYQGLEAYARYKRNSQRRPQAVGSRLANAWGFHDMHGNVSEWCSDGYDKSYYATSPEDDPPGSGNGYLRVLRGGRWDFSDQNCRSAYRGRSFPSGEHRAPGFRVVVSSAGD